MFIANIILMATINLTYIINLARRSDKRQHMQNEINKLLKNGVDINAQFFDAVDGNNDDILSKYNLHAPKWFDPNSGKAMTNGEVGCALSHWLIWNKIVEDVEANKL